MGLWDQGSHRPSGPSCPSAEADRSPGTFSTPPSFLPQILYPYQDLTSPANMIQGVYVLTDNSFRPFSRMSTEPGGQAVLRAQPASPPPLRYIVTQLTDTQFLWFPCGVVRGALAAMGINATVQAETNELPGAVFQIKTIPAKAS